MSTLFTKEQAKRLLYIETATDYRALYEKEKEKWEKLKHRVGNLIINQEKDILYQEEDNNANNRA